MFKKLFTKVRSLTSKQLVVAGVFTVALAGAVAGGMAFKQSVSAVSSTRDTSHNSIDYANMNGGAGALSVDELCKDIMANNPGDLQTIYAHFGVTVDGCQKGSYNDFRYGVIKRNGDVVVDGEVVMTDAWTMGRESWGNPNRKPLKIGNTTYYHAHPSVSFGPNTHELDVMVKFDQNGTVEWVVMTSCGNPITQGNKKQSGATCDDLKKYPVNGKENTYKFSTDVSKFGLAKITKVEYFIDGTLWYTDTNYNKDNRSPEYTFTKTSKVTTKVHVSLPGKKTKVIEVKDCELEIPVEKKVVEYVCKQLIPTARDNTNRKFRFTVYTKQTNATVKSVEFLLDGTTKTSDVTTKDQDGNIYQDYDFNDNVKHTVKATVTFTTHDGKTVTHTAPDCEQSVTPEEKPECPEKPGSGFPPGDERCKELPPELPKTGPGSLIGLFAGVSIAGGAAHRLFLRFRGQE